MEPQMSNLLKWSIENSSTASPSPATAAPTATGITNPALSSPSAPQPSSSSSSSSDAPTTSASTSLPVPPSAALRALFGGPSDADLMRAAMSVVRDPSLSLDSRLTAFDNLELLLEVIDNANNMESLGLWTPLVEILRDAPEPAIRRMAAWCVGTAVQNNARGQERALVVGAVEVLVGMIVGGGSGKGEEEREGEGEEDGVRRKALYALSSEVRNYQPAADAAVKALPEGWVKGLEEGGKVDAADMEAVDGLMDLLRRRTA